MALWYSSSSLAPKVLTESATAFNGLDWPLEELIAKVRYKSEARIAAKLKKQSGPLRIHKLNDESESYKCLEFYLYCCVTPLVSIVFGSNLTLYEDGNVSRY